MDDVKTYFIQADSGMIKIGKSTNPENRFAALKTASPGNLRLLGTIYQDIERELHEKFKKFRSHGEWFHPEKELRDFIRDAFPRVHVAGISKPVPVRDSSHNLDFRDCMEDAYDVTFHEWHRFDHRQDGSSALTDFLYQYSKQMGLLSCHDPKKGKDGCECGTCCGYRAYSYLQETNPDAVLIPTDYSWVGIVYYPFSSTNEKALMLPLLDRAFHEIDSIGPTLNVFYVEEDSTWSSKIALSDYPDNNDDKPKNLDRELRRIEREEIERRAHEDMFPC